jgi:hypothetical protein
MATNARRYDSCVTAGFLLQLRALPLQAAGTGSFERRTLVGRGSAAGSGDSVCFRWKTSGGARG